jgi:RNA ligase-like protein
MSDPARVAEKARKQADKAQRYAGVVADAAAAGIEFIPFPKISRLNRDITITEKIDGTNAAIHIGERASAVIIDNGVDSQGSADVSYELPSLVLAQSRTRIITPEEDNFGFARWVKENERALAEVLGPGTHFGEWWGAGIQRGYRQTRKWFSLFNYTRWSNDPSVASLASIGVQVIPILYHGPWMTTVGGKVGGRAYGANWLCFAPALVMENLATRGSVAATVSGVTYKKDDVNGDKGPEGIVVYHEAGRVLFKATIENDEQPKSFVQVEHEKWLDEIAKEPL